MKVVIIIITYNGMRWLKKCLESCSNHDIIVVDNNSTDKTVEYIKINYPKITLLIQEKNLGFGAANNIGIRYALNEGVDYIFLLNQDAYLQPQTINNLLQAHKSNHTYGIISPIHLTGNGKGLDVNYSNYIKVNDTLFYDALLGDYSKTLYEVPFINAAGWLLPSSTFDVVGGFDPIFFHYGEDNNYCQRCIFHGLKIGISPDSFLQHDRKISHDRPKLNKINKLALKELEFKIKWANINLKIKDDFINTRIQLTKSMFKYLFKFKFNEAKSCITHLILTKEILPSIIASRKKNIKKGKHYL